MASPPYTGDATLLTLLRSLFDATPLGVAFYDLDLRFIEANDAFAAIDGILPANHAGRTVADVLGPLARQIEPHVRTVLATGRAVRDVELVGIRNPRTRRRGRWLVSYHPVMDGTTVVAVMTIVSDVTAARRSEAILLAEKDVLERCARGHSPLSMLLGRLVHAISEHSIDGALPSILVLEDGRLRHISAPQLPPDFIAAMDGTQIGPRVGSCGTAAFTRQPVFVADIETDPLWTDFRAIALAHDLRACWSVPIESASGGVLGTLALYYRERRMPSAEDVTLIELMARTAAILIDWRRAEDSRQRLLEAERAARMTAEQANRGKDEFVATLSHELRTPLNAITGWLHILRTSDLDTSIAERAIDAIERNAQAQARLIEDLLDIARIVAGKMRVDIAAIDLGPVIDGALDTVKPLADAKRIRVRAEKGRMEHSIDADPARLRQLLLNLLTNAVKFTPAGGEVSLTVESLPSETRITVSDTGIGIAPDVLPHIFDRYRQGHTHAGGLGLGLAIARHVAELHGGSLGATSAGVGLGSRFDLVLPARKSPPPDPLGHAEP